MLNLEPEQIAKYFHRSFKAVDGLWFMKVEEIYGFETALDIDEAVWKIMPKIQARLLLSFSGMGKGLAALQECLDTKLHIEGYEAESNLEEKGGTLTIRISRCPWLDIITEAGRGHLADIVGTRICSVEYQIWAGEFGDTISFELASQLCHAGGHACVLRFHDSRA